MEEKITDKEFTFLSLKYGTDFAVNLSLLRSGAKEFCNRSFNELEHRAADLGDEILRKEHEKIVRVMSDEIKKEIDNEILNSIKGNLDEGTD